MDNIVQSSTHNRITLDKAKNTLKNDSKRLDKLSRLFVNNIAYKHSMKVLEIIDVKGIRIVILEDDSNTLYAISLITSQFSHNHNNDTHLSLSEIGRITKEIAYTKNAIAASSFIELD